MYFSMKILQTLKTYTTVPLLVVGLLAATQLSVPKTAFAVTNTANYQPESVTELIAYLYGIIASLEAQIGKQSSGVVSGSTNTTNQGVTTLTVQSVEEEEARLRGSVSTITTDYVLVSFEYGRSRSNLSEDTSTKRLSRSQAGTFYIDVDDLRGDTTYYYRAVVQKPNGTKTYGTVRSFTTDDDNRSSSNSNNRGDDELEFDESEYERGELIELFVDIDTELLPGSWIGLYDEDDKNGVYQAWQYVTADTDRLDFYAPSVPGDYEFRLFADSGYEDIATSDTFEVR
jgi:hypothetical protein